MFPFTFKKKKPSYAPLTPEQDAFLASCTQEYNEKLERLNRDWSFSKYKQWGFDQVSGVFFLQLHDGSRVEAEGQGIGSYSPSGKAWEWAWANPHVEEGLKQDVQLVRQFGEKERIAYLRSAMVPAPDKLFPMYLSGIATKIIGSEGVFAGSAGPILVYLSLKNLKRKPA
jgi:hypothetical protein